jgi:hypothetical protein
MQPIIMSLLSEAGKQIIYEVLNDTYSLIKDSIQNAKVNNCLTELDLIADLQVIEALVRDVAISEQHKREFIEVALANVKEILTIIKNELQLVQNELIIHENRYFSKYREPNIGPYLENLICHKTILDKRVTLLMEMLTIDHSTASTKSSSVINFEFPVLRESATG